MKPRSRGYHAYHEVCEMGTVRAVDFMLRLHFRHAQAVIRYRNPRAEDIPKEKRNKRFLHFFAGFIDAWADDVDGIYGNTDTKNIRK